MPRFHPFVLLLALGLGGCESQLNMSAQPARPALDQNAPVRAILAASAAGTLITIDNPGLLPAAVRDAADLKVAVGGRTTPVTRNPGGSFTFSLPAGTAVSPDVAGNLRVIFVMNDRESQIVTLGTGSPVQFATPPVLTDPAPAFIARGLKIKLKANTPVSSDQYQFTWSFSTSAVGPWQPIPGQGKEVEWEPAQAGNFHIKVDAVEKASQQAYSTTTTSPLIFVTDAKDVLTTEPPSGTIERGNPVKLVFVRPAGLTGTNLSYAWSYAPSPQGPFTSIAGSGESVSFLPTTIGSYYIRAEVSNRDTGAVNTFVSPNAVVFVNEGQPIITASQQTVERGDRVNLKLNIASATGGSLTWYFSRTGGALGANWTLMPGNNTTNDFIVNEAGSYNFRVDIPEAGGSIKTFTTTDPVLNVLERTPLLQTDPINEVTSVGSNVTFKLNARGVTEDRYKFVWYVSQNPAFGWQALPLEDVDDLYKKTYSWKTTTGEPQRGIPATQPGSYFLRVDATERTGTATYTFTSSAPVVTIED